MAPILTYFDKGFVSFRGRQRLLGADDRCTTGHHHMRGEKVYRGKESKLAEGQGPLHAVTELKKEEQKFAGGSGRVDRKQDHVKLSEACRMKQQNAPQGAFHGVQTGLALLQVVPRLKADMHMTLPSRRTPKEQMDVPAKNPNGWIIPSNNIPCILTCYTNAAALG
jgi:hypothetical protein